MGTDITIFCEGYLRNWPKDETNWINIDRWKRATGYGGVTVCGEDGFSVVDLINGSRDYGLFYLLAGVRGEEEENTYPPISKPKGLPENMDPFIKTMFLEIYEDNEDIFKTRSYLTLKELKDSGYGQPMKLQGWVDEEEFEEDMKCIKAGEKMQLSFVDIKLPEEDHQGMVLKEWKGYLCLNLIDMMERMEVMKRENGITNDEDIRIVFWFDW